jgi:hypothetical protein
MGQKKQSKIMGPKLMGPFNKDPFGGDRTRGTAEQGQRAYEAEQERIKEFNKQMDYIESQLSDNRGRRGKK